MMDTIENTGRSLALRRVGNGWQVQQLYQDGTRRLLHGRERLQTLLTLGVIYRRGACDSWPAQPAQ